MTTEVVNLYHLKEGWQDDPQYVYIGRPGKGLDGYFGNPYRLVSGNGRGATLARYELWLVRRLYSDPEFRDKVAALSGKTLVCFCKPNTCHGDILARAADAQALEDEYERWHDEAEAVFGDALERSPTETVFPDINSPAGDEYEDAV